MCPRLLFVLILCVLSFPGCSVVRGFGLLAAIKDNAPTPPQAVETKVESYPFLTFGNPLIRVTIESPMTSEAVLIHYRTIFRNKGWVEDRPFNPDQAGVPAIHEFQTIYRFHRKKLIGQHEYAYETVELGLWDYRLFKDKPESKTIASVMLVGHYCWDLPGTHVATRLANWIAPASVGWALLITTIF